MRSSLLELVCGKFNMDKKPALCGQSCSLSYADVDEISEKCGLYLYAENYYDEPVAVYMKRSPEEIAVFLGVWKGGCHYVALDTSQPVGRTKSILDRVEPRVVITDEESAASLRETGYDGSIVLYADIMSCDKSSDEDEFYRNNRIEDTAVAYITFTSGSTGIPKGVVTSIGAVRIYLEAIGRRLGVNEDTVFGNQSPLFLDACLKDVFTGLAAHATSYLIPSEYFTTPVRLAEFLDENRINTIAWVSSALSVVAGLDAFEEIKPHNLRKVAFGGERIDGKSLVYWMQAFPDAGFIHLYGTTECTGMSAAYDVPATFAADDELPIGEPLEGTELYLFAGEAADEGELLIKSPSFMKGYLNDKDMTEKAFAYVPASDGVLKRYYRTGDIVRRGDNGMFYYVCRNDRRIKHMGYRIELDEIEKRCSGTDGVREAVCIFDEWKNAVELKYTGNVTENELKEALLKELPRYMIPNRIVHEERLERTTGGKLNRK